MSRGALLLLLGLGLASCASLDRAEEALARGDHALARSDWEELARRGFPEAEHQLGRAIARGQLAGTPTEARRRLNRAFELGHDRSALELARFYADPGHELHSDDTAMLWLRRATALGSIDAEREIALARLAGRGVEQDADAALAELEALAARGDAESHYRLGSIHEVGVDAQPDFPTAARWYESAAALGHEEATVALARLQLAGRGLPQNDGAALLRLESAARAGNVSAASTLASLYGDPAFSAYDAAQARYWEQRSEALRQLRSVAPALGRAAPLATDPLAQVRRQAEAGNPSAATALGRRYAERIGAEPGAREAAIRWYRVGARAGSSEARSALGALVAPRRGGERADPEVVGWLRQAAAHGDASALRQLGDLHARRNLPNASPVEAAAHYLAASQAGDSTSLRRALEVIDGLSGAQTDAAYARSKELLP